MPSIKGTASVADGRAHNKALRQGKFPAKFARKVDVTKINRPVLTQWIEKRITVALGFEDEIVQRTAVNLFLPEIPDDAEILTTSEALQVDPRKAQVDLAGFLGEEEAAKLASEVWDLMLDAQEAKAGIPRQLLEEKKKELALAREQQKRQSQDQVRSNRDTSRSHQQPLPVPPQQQPPPARYQHDDPDRRRHEGEDYDRVRPVSPHPDDDRKVAATRGGDRFPRNSRDYHGDSERRSYQYDERHDRGRDYYYAEQRRSGRYDDEYVDQFGRRQPPNYHENRNRYDREDGYAREQDRYEEDYRRRGHRDDERKRHKKDDERSVDSGRDSGRSRRRHDGDYEKPSRSRSDRDDDSGRRRKSRRRDDSHGRRRRRRSRSYSRSPSPPPRHRKRRDSYSSSSESSRSYSNDRRSSR